VIVVDPGGGNVVTVESMRAIEDDIDRELAADRAGRADVDDTRDTGATRDTTERERST